MNGQLYEQERRFLHAAITLARPSLVFEVGTWKGGGSTYQIATALKANCVGRLITCEIDTDNYTEASSIYQSQEWNGLVECVHDKSSAVIARLIACASIPDFVFFDGAEDPGENLSDFTALESQMRGGSFFSSHDWDLGPRMDDQLSVKCAKLRPYLEQSDRWLILRTITKPISVGMVLAVRL